jgi:stalled ribosome alternative rescue factor ArfA
MPDYKNYNEDHTKKICFVCKKMLDVELFRIKEKKKGRGKGKYINNVCKQCEQLQVEEYRLTDIGIASEIVRRHKHVCKKQNLPFDLDREWVLGKLNSIGWKCELTGLPFKIKQSISEDKHRGFQWDSISVDRINHKSGYTKDNVRFILNQINVFRQDHSDDQMYMLAQALVDYRDKK